MSEYLRRFLRDYPGIADNPHIYTVDTKDQVVEKIRYNFGRVIRTYSEIEIMSIIKIHRTGIKEEVKAEITLPMSEVGLFLYGLELYKMGQEK